MNAANEDQSTEVLCLNERGICFAKKSKETPLDKAEYTSVWALDGTFDAQSINVINLSADNIKNGVLRLYDEKSNNETGKLLIFEGPAPATVDATYDERSIVEISSTGINVKLANGGQFLVDITNGFKIKNPMKDEVVSMAADGDSIAFTKTTILKHIDFGNDLRGLVMDRKTSDGKTHRGIGFIKI